MKIKTLPNGNMDLEGIKFVTSAGVHVTIGEHHVIQNVIDNKIMPGIYHHQLSWFNKKGEIIRHKFSHSMIVGCFASKEWTVKHVGKPIKIMERFSML